MRDRILKLALLLIGLLAYAHAFAEAGNPSSSWGLTWLIPWVPVVSATLALAQAIIARELTVETGWLHTSLGHTFLTVAGALIGTLTSFLANGEFTKQAAIAAIASAVGAFGGAWKTGGKSTLTAGSGKLAIPDPPKTAAVLLPFLFIAFSLSCAHSPGPVDPNNKYNQEFTQCLAQKGITVGVNDGTQIWKILDDPTTDQTTKIQQLEALGITTATDALTDLASCALYAWSQNNPISPNKNPTPAQAAVRVLIARHHNVPTSKEFTGQPGRGGMD